MVKAFFTFLLLTLTTQLFSQDSEAIYPDLKGQTLINQLFGTYKPSTVLGYDKARDSLWKTMANLHHDSLICIYTGFSIKLDPKKDPSTDAYDKGINCEHTWPQSKGAIGNAQSDMHHLFPVKEAVNSARGNYPFKEIPDNETDEWFRLNNSQTSKPSSNIDQYSEKDNAGYFEPRENQKGNIARAMFYFYTMYSTEANNADPDFFNIQKDILYQWHIQDPVDAEEIWLNDYIASKQGGKANPFILDSSLIRRAFFPQYVVENAIVTENKKIFETRQNYPNPFDQTTKIEFFLLTPELVNISVYDSKGKLVRELVNEYMREGQHEIEFDAFELENGIYYYQIKAGTFVQRMDMMLFR